MPKAKKPAAAKRPTLTNGELHELEDANAESAPASETDEGLIEFLSMPPLSAEHVEVCAGDQVVQLRQRAEVAREPDRMSKLIARQCERWAASERRPVRFTVKWVKDERTLAAQTIELGTPATNAIDLNGSVQSFLAQQQRNGLEQHKLYLESFEMVQESWKGILSIANRRNDALEKENAELRDRLRKADDVGSEIAIESARAEIEQRGRTADLIERRLLPIAEAVAVQKIQESAAASAAAAAVPARPKPQDDKTKRD